MPNKIDARVLACVVVAMACGACGPSGARLAKGPRAKPVSDAAVHAMCATDGGGDAASIQVWREKDGLFVVFELRADGSKKSGRSMTTFFDENGREMMRIGAQGGAVSSPEALEDDRKRESMTVDGKKAEVIACKGK